MFDIGIIGAGPAGYTAAIRASQFGLKVILFEKEHIGGTCLNKGCIPTKTILHSCRLYNELKNSSKYGIICDNLSFNFEEIQKRQKSVSEKIRKNLTNLIKSYGITIIEEEAKISSKNTIECSSGEYKVNNIIIATGSKPDKFDFNGSYSKDFILTSDDMLNLTKLPNRVLITGSGAIGTEWARILSSLGVKVVVIEMRDKLLPTADIDVSDRMERLFKKSRIEFYTSSTVENIRYNIVTITGGKQIETDNILIAAGRRPVIGEDVLKQNININKYIKTNSNFKTNTDNIFAIGDVNGYSMLAHSAMKQAEMLIDYIVSQKNQEFNKLLVPSVVYGTPETASIGETEQSLIRQNITYKKSIFPISALGKAYADDKIEGFVKILANDKQIFGVHIISEEAGAIIQQIAIAMANHLAPDDIHKVIFAHPSYSESLGEGISALNNLAIHIPNKKTELCQK